MKEVDLLGLIGDRTEEHMKEVKSKLMEINTRIFFTILFCINVEVQETGDVQSTWIRKTLTLTFPQGVASLTTPREHVVDQVLEGILVTQSSSQSVEDHTVRCVVESEHTSGGGVMDTLDI